MSDLASRAPEFDSERNRLYRIFKTVVEMLNDRGYQISSPIPRLDTPHEFYTQYMRGSTIDRESMSLVARTERPNEDVLLVFFSSEASVGVKSLRGYTERMVGQGSHHGIVIYQKSITSSGVRVINEMSGKFHLESFHEDDLLVNITKHVLVPKHHVLTLEEKRILLERYHLKDSQLPRIQPSDPVAKYFGLKRGQVVKITRASETAGRYITYRLCM